MIADVAFDVPLDRPFSYRVAEAQRVAVGQRVRAPLGGASRVGIVVALHDRRDDGLKPLAGIVDESPLLSPAALDLAAWIARESLSSLGSTCAALLPPASPSPPSDRASIGSPEPPRQVSPMAATAKRTSQRSRIELLVGEGRERRALQHIAKHPSPTLVLTSDIEAAGRWAQRLAKTDRVARLDSGVGESDRADAWTQLARGAVRVAVGTRSALLAPLPPGASIVLVDEHEAAHKPPGPPRIHSRDVVLERTSRDALSTLLTAATPSVEMWWRAEEGQVECAAGPAATWPRFTVADTRGILRREALTPPLARAVRETLAAGQRVFLGVSRIASTLACDDCGEMVRCEACGIALAYSRAGASLTCRLCGAALPLPDTCRACRGHRLSPFGWGAERVEHAVRRRFASARVARYDPDAARGARGEAQRAAAVAADVVVGTRGALKLFGPDSLGLAGFIAADQMMRQPDFRAGERAFATLWAAAERVRADGAVIIQSQNPGHFAFDAVARGDLGAFYSNELKFRAELGYPPFRRLAILTIEAKTPADSRRIADDVWTALESSPLTVYPPSAGRKERVWRIVIKGGTDLPDRLREALASFGAPPGRGIIEVEVDPVEWQF